MQDEMTCEEFKDTAPAYALAITSEAERSACTRHLARSGPHLGCPEAMGEARRVTDHLFEATPARTPSPRIWRAIEARITEVPPKTVGRRRSMREFGGWCVAAAAIGFYLFTSPMCTRQGPPAVDRATTTVPEVLGLMTAPGTRVVAFTARQVGDGRATLIVNSVQRRALVMVDQIPLKTSRRLRLWGSRGANDPIPLVPMSFTVNGVAAADLGATLFEPSAPDRLVLSDDGPHATSPGEILLAADIR